MLIMLFFTALAKHDAALGAKEFFVQMVVSTRKEWNCFRLLFAGIR
jgi:hypothetical protein